MTKIRSLFINQLIQHFNYCPLERSELRAVIPRLISGWSFGLKCFIGLLVWWVICQTILTLPLLAQEKSDEEPDRTAKELRQTIHKWSYSHYANDTLYWQTMGEEADIIGQKEFQVKKITLTYYINVEEGISTPTDKFIVLEANEGNIKRDDYSGVFKGDVWLTMPTVISGGLPSIRKMNTNTLNIYGLSKLKRRELTINSNEAVTLTDSTGMTITAPSFNAVNKDTDPPQEKEQSIHVMFKNASLLRLPGDAGEGQQIIINSDIMELYKPPHEEEIIVLKGKKEMLLFATQGKEPAKNDATHNTPASLWVTSEGNALIYPQFYKIFFQNKVRLIHTFLPFNLNNQKPISSSELSNASHETAKGTLLSNTLTIFIEPAKNEIRKALAEGNVILINRNDDRISGQMLEWLPAKHLATIKSLIGVKYWTNNNLAVADEIVIHTIANSPETLGNWEKIELKSKKSTGGTIKIHPPEEKK